MNLNWDAIKDSANSDGEFQISARFWNATLRLVIGKRRYKLNIVNGSIQTIERWLGGIATDVSIDAPEEDWIELLKQNPRPFYQDLYPASIHHGFVVSGDTDSYCAYFPAIRRLVEIMREHSNGN